MLQDLRIAGRMLAKARGFTALATCILALGIGANTAVFSILHGTLLHPPPYRDPGRLVDILDESRREARLQKLYSSYADFREYRRRDTLLEAVAGATWAVPMPILTGRGPSRQVTTIPVSDNFFQVLGVEPESGRLFAPSDAAGGCSVILAQAFRKEVFGGDANVVGQTLVLDGRSCAVVGVMPASFSFYPRDAQLWRVLTPDLTAVPRPPGIFILGRLRSGVTRAQVGTQLEAIHSAIHQDDGFEAEFRPTVDDLQEEFAWVAGRNLRTTVWTLVTAVALVLLIACLNVANLLLGRSLGRQREFAVRAALGAGRGRLVRQMLTEGLLLAGAGGALGVAIAWAAVRYFRAVNPVELPVGSEVRLSLPVLFFSAAVSIVTALIFGLAPAWRAARVDVADTLKSGGRGISGGGTRAARLLVAAQVALSVTLLGGAGLLIESVSRVGSEPLGFRPDRLYSARIILPRARYTGDAPRGRFFREMASRMAAQPGLLGTALGNSAPPFHAGANAVDIEGRPSRPDTAIHDVVHEAVSLGYFRTLGMTLLRGRDFDERDGPAADQVTIVDEPFVREYFPAADPIGQRIRVAGQTEPFPWVRIVGVVAPVKRTTVYREVGWIVTPTMYRPMTQHIPDGATVLIRAAGGAAPVTAAVRAAAMAIDPEAAIGKVDLADRSLAHAMAYPRFRAVVFGAFAAFALLLAAAGLYGVLNQMVAQRRPEIGVRMALGAQPSEIVAMVVRAASTPVLAGLVAGLGGALVLGRWGQALLYGVTPSDPATLAGVALLLTASAAAASALPARRAARTNPIETLRAE